MKMTMLLPVPLLSLLLLCTTLLLSEPGSCQTLNDTNTLTSNLLDDYNKNARPIVAQSSAVDVGVGMMLLNILEFDEVSETLTSVGNVYSRWVDSSLVWNPADYNGLDKVIMSYGQIWVPEIVVINPADGLNSMGAAWQTLRVSQNGFVWWNPGNIFKTSCPIDVTKYPFDTQTCCIEVYPWGYWESEVRLLPLEENVNLGFYTPNGVWTLERASVSRHLLPGLGHSIKFSLHLRRKPAFIIANVIIPILALSLLSVLVFILPVDAGERVSFSVTVLLSIAVFMTIVSAELPKTSEPMAVLVYVLMMEMTLNGLISLLTVLNLRVYYKDESCPIPGLLKSITLRLKGDNRCRATASGQDGSSGLGEERDGAKQNVKGLPVKKQLFLPELPSDDDVKVTWQDVSQMIDRLCFVCFLFFTLLIYIVFFSIVLTP